MFEIIDIANEFGIEFTLLLPQRSYNNGKGYFKIEYQIRISIKNTNGKK